MQKGITVFLVSLIVIYLLLGVVVVSNPKAATYAGIVALLAPFILAYIAHRTSGAAGNPFAGLVWGPPGLLFGTWLGGILVAAIVLAASVFMGLVPWDSSVSSFVDQIIAQSEAKGQPLPDQAISITTTLSKVGLYSTPLIVAWIMAAFGCLSTFPLYGWLARRLLVKGRTYTFGVLLVLAFVGSAALGGTENQMMPDWNALALPLRIVLYGILGCSFVPAAFWLFLKSRSAVITSMATASYSSLFQGAFAYTIGGNPVLGPPSGLAVAAGILLAGIALWVWKDPGGDGLAVAAVAQDGSPLTPDQLASLDASEDSAPQPRGSYDPTATVPPPPGPDTPGEDSAVVSAPDGDASA